jgi:hypothetical protein
MPSAGAGRGVVRIPTTEFSRPTVVETAAAQRAEATFRGLATARPSKQDACEAVLAFMRGQSVSDRHYHLAATALCEPFPQLQGTRAVGHMRFERLIEEYEKRAKNGELWRLTWYGLLASFFSFDSGKASENELGGWRKLRDMLRRTWPDIDRVNGTHIVPEWVKVMRRESQLLTGAPPISMLQTIWRVTPMVTHLVEILGSPVSWFWHSLVMAVCTCCDFKDDAEFRSAYTDPRTSQRSTDVSRRSP